MRTKITFIAGFEVGLVVFFALFLAPSPVHAAGRIPLILYRGGAQGRVVFDHQIHVSKGLHCNDCHTDFAHTGKTLFFTRKQGLISFDDHQKASKCFACHNANGALEIAKNIPFNQGAFNKCERCHRHQHF